MQITWRDRLLIVLWAGLIGAVLASLVGAFVSGLLQFWSPGPRTRHWLVVLLFAVAGAVTGSLRAWRTSLRSPHWEKPIAIRMAFVHGVIGFAIAAGPMQASPAVTVLLTCALTLYGWTTGRAVERANAP